MVRDVVEVEEVLVDYAFLLHRVYEFLDHCVSSLHLYVLLFLKPFQVLQLKCCVHTSWKLTKEIIDDLHNFSVVSFVITEDIVIILAFDNLFFSYTK
jgi:hypothetical protein